MRVNLQKGNIMAAASIIEVSEVPSDENESSNRWIIAVALAGLAAIGGIAFARNWSNRNQTELTLVPDPE